MNIYPIFELEKVFLTKGYQYALVNRKAIYYSWGAPTRQAEHGDILLVDSVSDFWVCTLKNGEFWENTLLKNYHQNIKPGFYWLVFSNHI